MDDSDEDDVTCEIQTIPAEDEVRINRLIKL
jgi:hypothetical protein